MMSLILPHNYKLIGPQAGAKRKFVVRVERWVSAIL